MNSQSTGNIQTPTSDPVNGTGIVPPIKNADNPKTTQQPGVDSKNFFNTKNIVIGVLAIGAIVGILKYTKVI